MSSKKWAGHKARETGNLFEHHLIMMVEKHGGVCIKIPNAGRVTGSGHNKKFVKAKSPFDFLVAKDGGAMAFDCKATTKTTVPFSMIKQHQLNSLLKCAPHIPAGYLVWFQITDQVVWFPALLLATVEPRQSLAPQDGHQLGTTQWGYNPLDLLK